MKRDSSRWFRPHRRERSPASRLIGQRGGLNSERKQSASKLDALSRGCGRVRATCRRFAERPDEAAAVNWTAHCGAANCVEALGYYERWVSYLLEALRIWVRRFRCRQCKVSISCLPDFAQPYRVVNSATVQAGFNQERTQEVVHWGWLIEAYWRKFSAHLPDLLGAVGSAFGPCPVDVGPQEFWDLLVEKCTHLEAATQRLVHQFRTCLFGRYKCHQRKDFSK